MDTAQEINKTIDSNSSSVTIDLRGNNNIRKMKNYKLSDIVFTPSEYSDLKASDVVPLILLEKQPKYPTYADSVGDTVYSAYEWGKNKLSNLKVGKAGTNLLEYTLQNVGKEITNNIVSSLSQAENASAYWSNPEVYGYHMFGLFNIEGGAPIMTYELPFFSDYFLTTNGSSGWKTGGAEMWYGRNLSQLVSRFANIGYPVTPDWEFNPNYESIDFNFHLLNDSAESVIKNTIWLYSLAAGTMYVQIENKKVDLSSKVDKSMLSTTLTLLNDYLASASSFFKSPNVYEAIVPGRFRWLWCTMEVDIKCAGKLIRDDLSIANNATQSMTGKTIAFPEAYKITVRLRSLLPQSFNQFNYFLTTKHSDSAVITDPFTSPQMVEGLKSAISGIGKITGEVFRTDAGATTITDGVKKGTEYLYRKIGGQ